MWLYRKMNKFWKYEISLYESNQKDIQSKSNRKESQDGRRFQTQDKSQFKDIQETQRLYLTADALVVVKTKA